MIYDDSKTRAKNRQKIVEEAKKLFIERGIAQTTVSDIVKKAKLERKTFYNYFEDKEEIADYIYYQLMETYYRDGFTNNDYKDCENGYQKVKKYLTTMVNHFVMYDSELLFAIHYDYYFKRGIDRETLTVLFKKNHVYNPDDFIVEAYKDGSINIGNKDPIKVLYVISQSIGAYASRLIFRGFRDDIDSDDIKFDYLYDLLDLHLNAIKK